MDLAALLARPASIRRLDGPTLFRVALALRRESRNEAARRLGITSSAVAMYLDPLATSRTITAELARKVERLYGVPADAWEKKQ